MSKPLTSSNEWWLAQDGKRVMLDGLAHVLTVRSYTAVYPVCQEVLSVYADPVNKRSKQYLETKAKLGDDWSTDVLESPDVEVEIRLQLGGH